MNTKKFLSVLLFVSLLLAGQTAIPAHAIIISTIRYASPAGVTTGGCTSWGTACDLQYAISVAVSSDEVWVKQGTYKPTTTTDRTISFVLKNGVAIYGGFAGSETLRSQRNPTANVTTLSGEIGDPGLTVDNSYHVVVGGGTDSSAVLNGFTITAGNANNPNNLSTQDIGGGTYNNGSSPTLTNLVFVANAAITGGGGMANWNLSNPALTNVSFISNSATNGGAMYNETSSPTLMNATFDNNTSSGSFGGGAMFNDGDAHPGLTDVTFSNNSASGFNGGAMVNQDGSSSLLTNVTFSGNSGGNGGAIYNTFVAGNNTFTNVTFSGNTASGSGGAVYNDIGATVTLQDSIFWGDGSDEIVNNSTGTSTIDDSVVAGGCPSSGSSCSNVFNADPLLGGLANNGGVTQTMALNATSAALDSGNDAICAGTDQRGVTRPQGPHCDIGAYEHVYSPVLYANPLGLTGGYCDSWANSCVLSHALGIAVSGEQIWAKAGLYFPTGGADRTISFTLKDGVAIYGGFAGGETLLSQRNPAANVSVLDGNIGLLTTSSDNSYHVVDGARTDSSAVLDGFTIADGNANGGSFDSDGGGMTNAGSPTLSNVTFDGNVAAAFGGGMYNNNGSPTLTNLTFTLNTAGLGGGGMYNNTSNVTLTNATFNGNIAGTFGGGMENDFSTPVLTNVTLSGNSAASGGGAMDNVNSNPHINDTILWGDGSEFDDVSSAPIINDSVVAGGCPLGATCSNIVTTDPLLASLQNNGGSTKTMALLSGSSAIDTGNNSTCAGTDQRGQFRPKDGDNNGTSICDIGAYEFFPLVNVHIGGVFMGSYDIPLQQTAQPSYTGVNNGPVLVTSTNSTNIIASERVAYFNGIAWTSFSELMGLPLGQLTTSYVMPWYNNVDLNTQLRFGNAGASSTTVTVTVAGVVQGTYPLAPSQSARISYPGLNNGPVVVSSSGGVPIIASQRVAYFDGSAWTSFSEMLGLPAGQLTTSYVVPWYNNVDLNTQLRFGNMGGSPTVVTVKVAGVIQGTYPLAPNQSVRVSYTGLNNGPVQIQSSGGVPIIASERVAYYNGIAWTSYSELMGLPAGKLTSFYVMPFYDNVNFNDQLRFGNVGSSSTTVTVTVGGVVQGTYPLAPSQSVRVSYAGLNNGPVQVQSSGAVPIIVSGRVAYYDGSAWTSFSELMGLPLSQLATSYVMPWYNNVDLNTQLRIGVP